MHSQHPGLTKPSMILLELLYALNYYRIVKPTLTSDRPRCLAVAKSAASLSDTNWFSLPLVVLDVFDSMSLTCVRVCVCLCVCCVLCACVCVCVCACVRSSK